MSVGSRTRDPTDSPAGAASLYPLALGCGTLGAGVGTYAAGAVVPAAVLAVLGGLILATLAADDHADDIGGR
ncbi:MAG: hypothetical protein ABEJ43_07635 [Haloferacaceae archaeon]